jgi:site-specific DNA-methyltransferase (adenine-specific)
MVARKRETMSILDYTDDNINLLYGDCLERLKDIPNGSIDMVLTDPPYGTTACKWDSIIPLEPMWQHLKRVIKPNGAIVMTASQPFTTTLISSNIRDFKYCWYWEKSKASNFPHAPNMPLKIIEDVIIFSGGTVGHISQLGEKRVPYTPQGTIEGKTIVKQNKNTSELKYHRESQTNHTTGYKCKLENYPKTLLKIKSENGCHPTQKPVALMEYLIKTYTNESETVLDFTMGSGTTGVACKNLNRNFIGIELDLNYYCIASQRIINHDRSR